MFEVTYGDSSTNQPISGWLQIFLCLLRGRGMGGSPWISPLICPNGFPSLDTKRSHPKLRFRRGIYVYIPCFSHHLHWMYRYRLFIKMTCDKSQAAGGFLRAFLLGHSVPRMFSMHKHEWTFHPHWWRALRQFSQPIQFNIESRSNARKIEPEKAWKKALSEPLTLDLKIWSP